MSAKMKAKDAAAALRARARAVRHDGSYGGIFEMCVWCHMTKAALLLAVGVNIINVLGQFGKNLKAFTPSYTHKMVAGKMVNKKLMSASKPGGSTIPDVNHFVVGRSKVRGKGRVTPSGASAEFLPDGSRRSAAAVADECEWRLICTNEEGDGLMDCFAHYMNKSSDAVSWKSIRTALADEMDKIAEKAALSKADAWVDCFMVCEETALARALMSSPIQPDATPEFNIQVYADVLDDCDAMASSSSSSNVPVGVQKALAAKAPAAKAHVADANYCPVLAANALDAKAPAADANSCPGLAADAAVDAEAKADSTPIGNKRRKLPASFLATGNAESSAGSSGDTWGFGRRQEKTSRSWCQSESQS